jgi:hypothetical protein
MKSSMRSLPGGARLAGRSLVLAGLLVALASPPLFAAGVKEIPPHTDIGSIEGTWFYADPGFNIAIYVWRDEAGTLRLRYQVKEKGGVDYATDAGGYAKYVDGGNIVEVLFTGAPSGRNSI